MNYTRVKTDYVVPQQQSMQIMKIPGIWVGLDRVCPGQTGRFKRTTRVEERVHDEPPA